MILTVIEPEIIPSSSSDGESAIEIVPKWAYLLLMLISVLLLASIFKALVSISLMLLGLLFLWKQATRKLSSF